MSIDSKSCSQRACLARCSLLFPVAFRPRISALTPLACVSLCVALRPSVGGCGAPARRAPSGAAGPSTCPGQTAPTAPLERYWEFGIRSVTRKSATLGFQFSCDLSSACFDLASLPVTHDHDVVAGCFDPGCRITTLHRDMCSLQSLNMAAMLVGGMKLMVEVSGSGS